MYATMLHQVLLVASLAAGVYGSPRPVDAAKRATPTVYLAGDSTMAKTSNGLDGNLDSSTVDQSPPYGQRWPLTDEL